MDPSPVTTLSVTGFLEFLENVDKTACLYPALDWGLCVPPGLDVIRAFGFIPHSYAAPDAPSDRSDLTEPV
jgi:hypothetical protein